jgi:prolyl-tRNA editing enzyme YbaK/EbsC (Cys-tRNA(Pro) deacylase)
MKASVRRVHDALVAAGVEPHIREHTQTTRTAEEAAAAIGTTVPRIVKSLVFMSGPQPVLALVSGGNHVDLAKLANAVGAPIERASPDQVRGLTGFAIGGVAPLGHATSLRIVMDRDLLQFDEVWVAAGTPNAVFPIDPRRLAAITGAAMVDLKVEGGLTWTSSGCG